MATLKYFLKNISGKNKTLVNLIFQYGYFELDPKSGRKKYKFLKMSTGDSIEPKYWNFDRCRARETKAFPQYPEFNSRLEYLENLVFNIFRRMSNDGDFPTPTQLKQAISTEISKKKLETTGNPDKIGFFDFIRKVIEESENGKRLTDQGKQLSRFTIKGYNTTLNHLEDFQQSRGQRIEFDGITMEFYREWLSWFNAKNKSKNTIGKHIKNLKVFMGEAFERGVTKNNEFMKKKFRVLEEETDAVYLTKDEINRMALLDLTDKPELDLARDNFLLDCYIGLRIADYKNLRKDHIQEIDGKKMIKIRLQKTGANVVIPLNQKALNILEKHDYDLKTYSDQDINRKIKVIGKMAGIEDDFSKTITLGGKVVENVFRKYEKITNHTARRTFATNLYLEGVPTLDIMQMTGHKTERAFLKYIRVTPEENAIRLAKKHEYFKLD